MSQSYIDKALSREIIAGTECDRIDADWLRKYGFTDHFVEGEKCLAFGPVALCQWGDEWRLHIGGWWEWLPRPTRMGVLELLGMFQE